MEEKKLVAEIARIDATINNLINCSLSDSPIVENLTNLRNKYEEELIALRNAKAIANSIE